MKRLAIVLLLLVLLVGVLGGCGGTSDLEAYEALLHEMAGLREYWFRGNVTLSLEPALLGSADFQFADFMPLRFSVEGTVSYADQRMQARYLYRQADGTPMFDLDMVLADGAMYVGLTSLLDFMLRPIFAQFGLDLSDYLEDLLEGYGYLLVPYGGTFEETVFAPADFFGGMNVEPFLTRQGNAFVVTVSGEDVRGLTAEMGALLAQFIPQEDHSIAGGGTPMGGVVGDVGALLASADLTHARVVMATARVEDSFYQSIELEIPGALQMRAEFGFTVEPVPFVSVPGNALTEDALAELLMNVDFDAIFGVQRPGVSPGEPLDIAIAYDLETLILVGHALEEDSLLRMVALGDGDEREYMVAVIDRSFVSGVAYHLFVDADAIEMFYSLLGNRNAVEAILLAVERDRVEYFLPDSWLTFSALRTNESRDIAALAVVEQTAAGLTRVFVYLGQEVYGTGDVVRLEMVFYLDLFHSEDRAVLEEFGWYMGIDLGAVVTELLGPNW
ncbi:MAG: hypothetical protein FWE12_00950 [Oscillospiraceae bacterium]|nr:hypothetical protein [Oscillospiraceae bacterium]